VPSGRLPYTQGRSDEPEQGEDHRGDPEQVERETGSSENERYERYEQYDEQDHGAILPIPIRPKRKCPAAPG
jgi:hypothetical protein